MKFPQLFLSLFLTMAVAVHAETSIEDVLKNIDASGKAKEVGKEYSIKAIVAVRHVEPDGKVYAWVLNPGQVALQIFSSVADAKDLVPRNEVTLTGVLQDGPFGAGLELKAGTVKVLSENQKFTSKVVSPDVFKDASAIKGRYVRLVKVTFTQPQFDASGRTRVRTADGLEIGLLVGKGVSGKPAPQGAQDVMGIPVSANGTWQLVAARFLPSDRLIYKELASKHTCLTCHTTDTKLTGPSYRDVAIRYCTDPEAHAKVIHQIEEGGSGKWGTAAMTPFKGKVPPEDMEKLTAWILSYRWDGLLAE